MGRLVQQYQRIESDFGFAGQEFDGDVVVFPLALFVTLEVSGPELAVALGGGTEVVGVALQGPRDQGEVAFDGGGTTGFELGDPVEVGPYPRLTASHAARALGMAAPGRYEGDEHQQYQKVNCP